MVRAKIRTLSLEDYEDIIELWKRADLPYKPEGRDNKQMMKLQMEAFPELFLGAFLGKLLVGVAIGSYDSRMKGWINRLAVDPEHRRTGIARQLILEVEKALESRGAVIFAALIERQNEESLTLFGESGYVAHQDILYVSRRKSEDL